MPPPPPAPQAQQAEQAQTPADVVPSVPDTGPPPTVAVATSNTTTTSPAAETSPTTSTTSPTLTQPPPTPATNSRPDPANTRVLLRSLEELRDSLSVRVEQLSLAVDRLRGQATELERAVTSGTALAPGFGRPVPTSAARFDPLPAPALAPRRYTTVRAIGDDEAPYESLTQHTTRRTARTGSVAAAAGGRGAAPSRLGPITRRGGATAAALAAAATAAATTSAPSPTSPAASRSVDHHPRVGSSPTNLKVMATQPKPIVVRSPRPSAEPAAPTPAVTVSDDGAESGSSTPQAHATAVLPPIVSDDDTAPRLRPPPRLEWTLSAVMERRPSPEPTSAPIRPRRIASVLDQNRAPTLATLSARGITTRGMMVRERQGLNAPAPQTASSTSSSDSSSDELLPFTQVMAHRIRDRTDFAGAFRFQEVIADHPPPARDIETLDREIQLYLTRLAASQREWTRAWEMERDRAMQGGRVPNEFSAQRESAMRNHVANSHRLWYLLSRRASRRGPRDRDTADSQPAVDVTATRLPVRDYPSSPRAANRPVSVYAGTAPPMPNDATIEDMERRWIERIERERAGGPSEASEDQFEFEYYRNYLYENRRSRRSLSSTTDDSGDADDSWPQRRLELLELIAQSRSYVTGAAAPTTAPATAPTVPTAAPTTAPSDEAEDTSGFSLPSAAVDYVADMEEREVADAAISGVFNLPASISANSPGEDDFWHSRRRDLLEYIEQSRARVHDMARELSPSVLQEERPALRRVLEGLERMLALDDDMSPDMRARLERLAARERELLRDIGEEPPAPVQRSAIESLASVEVTTRRGDRQRQVVERIERTRSRLRELSRIHRDLSTVRAGMGLAPVPRAAQSPLFTRRDSDAETVVPDLGSPEETFWAADEDADDAEPASGPTTGSNSDAQLRSSLMSLSLSADSEASSEPESTDAREGVRTFAFEDDGVADKEGGLLAAETWPAAPALPRRARRYVSLVDL